MLKYNSLVIFFSFHYKNIARRMIRTVATPARIAARINFILLADFLCFSACWSCSLPDSTC